MSEALANSGGIENLIVNSAVDSSKLADVLSQAEERHIVIEEVPDVKFSKLSSTGTSQGIVAIATMRTISVEDLVAEVRTKRSAVVLALDRITDPGNLGTILRSSAWFGVDAVFTGRGSVDIYNPKVVRSAMAAIATLNVVQDIEIPPLVSKLKELGLSVVGGSPNGRTIYYDYRFPRKVCLIFGSEATGIDKHILEICDETLTIPRIGKMESLNVGVASSVVISELVRQQVR